MTKKRCRAFGPTAIFLFASCDVMHPFSAAYAPYTERRFDDMLDHQAGAEPNIRHTEHQSQKAHDRQRKEPKRYVVDYEGGFHIAAAAQYADDHGRGVAMEGHGERVGKHHNGAEPCGLSCEPKERQNLGTQHGEKSTSSAPPSATPNMNEVKQTALPMLSTPARLPTPISLPTMTAAALARPKIPAVVSLSMLPATV